MVVGFRTPTFHFLPLTVYHLPPTSYHLPFTTYKLCCHSFAPSLTVYNELLTDLLPFRGWGKTE
ncbi:hypothetical protein ESW18_20385 [Algoriphagus ratkowskyi]|uniref:Uncharacterized protein n=1 Tax=Algoriphagus ratkowskyi TaxID=57028 RepID=A0ABY3HLA1_9BACT|nr:hypothetical protein ESW18_20385 [Algoriphagus ratkowskyi]